jgi:NAD(P)-dependent dehydrogenase (short-subunit alcohol dehydrogenase family)
LHSRHHRFVTLFRISKYKPRHRKKKPTTFDERAILYLFVLWKEKIPMKRRARTPDAFWYLMGVSSSTIDDDGQSFVLQVGGVKSALLQVASCFAFCRRQKMRFQNKVVVVTGGGSGIGAALARAFDQEGAIVAVSDLKGADQVAQSLQNPKSRRGYQVDVTNAKQVQDMIQSIMKEQGRIDIYCSNAGIIYPAQQQQRSQSSEEFGVVSRHSDAQWNRILQVNLQSHVIAVRELLPYWSNQQQLREKHFLITASAAGLLTQIGDASYGVSKAAAIAFAEHMAIAHGGEDHDGNNIHVHCLCPQAVDTPFGDNIVQQSRLANSALSDGIVTPEFVADCCLTTLAETNDFFIFPHPRVQEYCKRKVLEHERWLKGMRKMKRRLIQQSKL